MPQGKNYKDMSQEEKAAAFDQMQEKRQSRKGNSTAKRSAVKDLIAAHKAEYDASYAKYLKAKPVTTGADTKKTGK